MTRIIGIAGPSFCGSTLLNAMLGQLHGVMALGETHWILTQGTAVHMGVVLPRGKCMLHGDDCPTWTPEVLAELRAGGTDDWFQRLATAACNPNVIVSSDKNLSRWKQLGAPDVAVLPYKTPGLMLASYRRRGFEDDVALAAIAAEYNGLLDFMEARSIPCVSVPMGELIYNAPMVVGKLAEVLDLPLDRLRYACTPWDDPQCCFGGNPAWPDFGRELRPGRWEDEEACDEKAELALDATWKRLDARHF